MYVMNLDRKRQAIGERVRRARQAAGFTQSQLAERAQIDQGYLARIERGLKWPSLETLYRLASALGVPASSLLEDPAGQTSYDQHRQEVVAALSGCQEEQVRFVLRVIAALRELWPQHERAKNKA